MRWKIGVIKSGEYSIHFWKREFSSKPWNAFCGWMWSGDPDMSLGEFKTLRAAKAACERHRRGRK